MKAKHLRNLGIPKGEILKDTVEAIKVWLKESEKHLTNTDIYEKISAMVKEPEAFLNDMHFAAIAKALNATKEARKSYVPREEPATYQQWGSDFETQAIVQMENACKLPISVRGALMPDAHVGYGLPIGGVLATKDAVIHMQ